MKSIVLYLIINLFFVNLIFSQSTVVKNLNLYYKDKKAFINYDLKDYKSKNELHSIQLFFKDEKFNISVPEKITGDVGKSVTAGENKQIQWSLFDDEVNITKKLQPILIVDELDKGGSNYVFLSMLIPGLGDYFVENPRNMVFKPYLRTITALGAITLGVIADQKRVKLVWKRWDTKINDEIGWYWKDDYWLFSFDKEIFYFVGISVWVLDMIWVYAKGSQNEKLRPYNKYKLFLSTYDEFTNFGLNINF